MDIWSLAKQKLRENEEKAAMSGERIEGKSGEETQSKNSSHMIICGNSQSGKSLMVHKFLDKSEQPKETIALEYIYARRTRGNNKDVCHIWELGGGHKFSQLLSIPLVKQNIETASVVLALDLTRPNELWIMMEALLAAAGRYADAAIGSLVEKEQALVKNRLDARMSDYEEDRKLCTPFAIPLLIVGTRYDEFQMATLRTAIGRWPMIIDPWHGKSAGRIDNHMPHVLRVSAECPSRGNRNFDSELRRRLCSTLRFVAHYYGAHLMFYSCYNEQLVKLGRSLFSHLAFGTSLPKAKADDHNRPIYVPCGMDTFESIGPPPIDSASFARAGQPLLLWKNAFCEYFEQKELDSTDKSSDEQQLFLEPMIDNMVAQREKDLEVYIKQKKDRQAAEARAAGKLASS